MKPLRTLPSPRRRLTTLLGVLLAGAVAYVPGRAQTGAPAATTTTYAADESLFPNPETGVFYSFFSTGTSTFLPAVSNIRSTLRQQRQKGVSTVFLTYYLGDYKYQDLPATVLDRIDADLATLRDLGLKAIPHFHYAYEYDYENPQDWREPERDASRDIIVRHCAQLKPVWTKNADVLAFIAWGMIGPWGEQWISASGNLGVGPAYGAVNDNTRAIFRAMLDATPAARMVCFTPPGKRGLYGDAPTTAAEAFRGSDKARVGFENQCFLTDSPSGNYNTNDYRGPTAYLAVDGLYVPQLGFPDTNCGSYPTADQLIAELDAGHWDHLVPPTKPLRAASDTDPEVVRVLKKVGYRYRLLTAEVPDRVVAGQAASLRLTLVNDNGGTLYNARQVEVILRHQATGQQYVQNVVGDEVGNRLFFPAPHETKTWTLTLTPPTMLPPGAYDVLLNLPDPYPSLHDRPEYSIRLANLGTWEAATGYNSLLHPLTLMAPATPLPVALTHFEARAVGNGAAELRWATASETDNAGFAVEASADGQVFRLRATVPGAPGGSSAGPRDYRYLDEPPAGATGLVYYRLHQLDQRGPGSYSPVRAVRLASAALAVSAFPNPAGPATLTLQAEAPAAGELRVRLVEARGREVGRASFAAAPGLNRWPLPVPLAPGIYLLEATFNGQTSRQRLVVE